MISHVWGHDKTNKWIFLSFLILGKLFLAIIPWVQFGRLWAIRSNLVCSVHSFPFSPFRSNLVYFSPLGPLCSIRSLWSNLIHFGPFRPLWSILVHVGPFNALKNDQRSVWVEIIYSKSKFIKEKWRQPKRSEVAHLFKS